MEYALILACLLLGIGFHVAQKAIELDKLKPDDSLSDVFVLLWKDDKITILISIFLIIPLIELFYYILLIYGPDSITTWDYFDIAFFGASLVLGYAGQRIVYGALGKAVDYAEKKVGEKLN